ncbi:oxygenase MpaB family protein [Nocardia grenadensis]|uniref:oxygenase MpaB family protein n=1 Tax=Nocardia grenadensis TaxID=931537 RepID=UPI0007A412F3|nr:oxygenase MpaB family protein [Nocardia grenadensis]
MDTSFTSNESEVTPYPAECLQSSLKNFCHALNPEVYWWTHATFVELTIALNEHFGTPLTTAEKDQLIAEGVTWWRMYRLSDRVLVADYAEFEEYWHRTIDEVFEANATTDFALRSAAPGFRRCPVSRNRCGR